MGVSRQNGETQLLKFRVVGDSNLRPLDGGSVMEPFNKKALIVKYSPRQRKSLPNN